MICHAEENAIMHAARTGISLKNCVAYVTWPPCTRCARSLIQAGVSEIVYPKEVEIPERWEADFDMSLKASSEKKRIHFQHLPDILFHEHIDESLIKSIKKEKKTFCQEKKGTK